MQQLKSELANFSDMPNESYIRLPVLQALYGLSKASIYRGIKKGLIPTQVKISERCSGWNVGLVRAALAAKAGV